MKLPFKQVDVFTSVPFGGNPVAVVLDARGLSESQMQRIANWTNLSETTFVLPPTQPEADYRVRIFTPRAELPFAGHPTLGTAHALLEAGKITATNGRLTQECATGLIALTVSTGESNTVQIAFELPLPSFSPLSTNQVDELEEIIGAAVLRSHPPKFVIVGPTWDGFQPSISIPSRRVLLPSAPMQRGLTLQWRFAPSRQVKGSTRIPCAAAATVLSPPSSGMPGWWRRSAQRTPVRKALLSAGAGSCRSPSTPAASFEWAVGRLPASKAQSRASRHDASTTTLGGLARGLARIHHRRLPPDRSRRTREYGMRTIL